jgi:hypothetical protein
MPISTINQNGLTNPLTSLASNTIQVSTGGSASAPAISKSDDTNTGMFFPAADTIAFTEGGTEAMRLTSAGDVGIGSTSINNNKLLVKAAHVGGRSAVAIQTDQSATGSPVYLGFYNSSDTRIGLIGCDTATNMQITAIENVPIIFYTNNLERMRINSGGEVAFNAPSFTTSANMLSIVAGRILLNKSDDWGIEMSGATTTRIRFYSSAGGQGTSVGSITVNTSNTSYNTSSDYRLKENIAPMTGALAKVTQLKPCSWTWKLDGSAGQGFIAHELQAIIPDAVTGEKDGEQMQGVDTSYLVATLTAAIQELKAEFDAYKASHP